MTTTPTTSRAQEVQRISPEIVDQLTRFKRDEGLSDRQLGALTGTNSTQINRALNGKFIGNPEAFEERVTSFFRRAPELRITNTKLFKTAFGTAMGVFLGAVHRTEDIGLVYAPAGKGKTCGIGLYCLANPATIPITLTRWRRGPSGLEKSLSSCVEMRGWKRTEMSRGDFLVSRLRGSRRLIVVDNAHRLTPAARDWIIDFHDATGCPVALVGNPEALDAWSDNDQQFSRIGLCQEIKAGAKSAARHDAEEMVRLHWPEAEGRLGELPIQVVTKRGHLRALKKQLLLARDIAAGDGEMTAPEAFLSAHEQLIRNYALRDQEAA